MKIYDKPAIISAEEMRTKMESAEHRSYGKYNYLF